MFDEELIGAEITVGASILNNVANILFQQNENEIDCERKDNAV